MSKRYENFDYLRGLAIIGVILIHIKLLRKKKQENKKKQKD